MKWNCGRGSEGENKAKAIKEFADYVYYTNLFSQQEESCDAQPTPAPTASQQPSASMLPTVMPAPDCSDMETADGVKFEGPKSTRTRDHVNKILNTINDGKKRFQVDRNCAFNIRDTDWKNVVRYGVDIARWLDDLAKMVYGATRVENGSKLIPETPIKNNVSYYQCGGKWCTKIAAGKGVTGDYIWETDTSTRAKQFRDFLRSRINGDPEIFKTKLDGSMTCGTMPYCYDDKSHTTCYIDHVSENCGPWDFVVKGDVEGGEFRTGDVMEFFKTCTNSFGCTLRNPTDYDYQVCGFDSAEQSDYRGNVAVTKSGRECMRWDSQSPHKHSRTAQRYPDSGLVENYCRNPDGENHAWCYTMDSNKRWEFCDIPNCKGSVFQYHNSINRYAYYDTKLKEWTFKLSGSKAFKKGDRDMEWSCPTYEAADGMKKFASKYSRKDRLCEKSEIVSAPLNVCSLCSMFCYLSADLYNKNMWWYDFKCTEAPTTAPTPAASDSPTKSPTETPSQAPTECVDSLLSRDPLNIAVVVDMSYSTYKYTFDGTPIGDVNNDGKPNTILDAEIQATIELLKVIQEDDNLNNANTNIGLVVFDTEAKYVGSFNPLDASNSEPNQDLLDVLTSLETHKKDVDVAISNTGFTNFDDALDKTIDYFQDGAVDPYDRTNIMVFLSDGVPNVRGDGDAEAWCTNTTGVDCSMAPGPDPTKDWSDEPWEEGELSFCKREDTTCYENEYMGCALGIYTCQNTEPAMSYDSELNKLKEWGVYNLAIGVGAGSEVQEGSALFLIDSNPNKNNGILPYQVFTTDDLSTALKNLCIENTDPPTVSPTSAPTASPTVSPAPSLNPTAGPTTAPTMCSYTDVDFNTAEGQATIDAANWRENGFRVDSDGSNDLSITSYGGEIGDALALTPKAGASGTPDNEIIFTLDGTFENTMKIVLYDVDSTSGCNPVVRTQLPGGSTGTTTDIQTLGTSAEQTLEIPVEGVWRVIVDLCGTGAITEIGVCRDPAATPAPIGLSPPSETNEPTPSPVGFTKAPTSCPDDVKLIDHVGQVNYSDLPITVIGRTKQSVKFVVSNTWSETLDYVYVQYNDLNRNEPCVRREAVTTSFDEEFEAICMDHTPVTIVGIWVSDDSLSAATDVAEIPRCCHGPDDDTNPKVHYTFEILCYCPGDEAALI